MDDNEKKRIMEAMGILTYDGTGYIIQNGVTKEFQMKVETESGKPYLAIDSLTRELVEACEKISSNPTLIRQWEENKINTLLRGYFESSIKHLGYSVLDQTLRGLSAEENKAGSLDFRIEKGGKLIAICEALIHKGKDTLLEHIRRATVNYNQSGCNRVYIISYFRNDRFEQCWKNLSSWAREAEGIAITNEITTGYSGIRCLGGTYDNDGIGGDILFIGVHIK